MGVSVLKYKDFMSQVGAKMGPSNEALLFFAGQFWQLSSDKKLLRLLFGLFYWGFYWIIIGDYIITLF